MDSCESEDLERFLTNVDRISELVKELNSSDVAAREKAIEKADSLVASLEREKTSKNAINRTVINTKPTCEHKPGYFMKALEKDAEERRIKRQVKVKEANVLKEKGNHAFALGDYEMAVSMYTEALEQLRDMPALYTNRAQALIKLKRYKEAISDCEWALKCSDKCIKAYVHMGKAHLWLKNFKKSRLCYEKVLDIAPERGTLVKDYLAQVDLEEKKYLQEKTALRELNDRKERAMAIPELLEKLGRPNEHNLYYCGGLALLTHAVTDTAKTVLLCGQQQKECKCGYRIDPLFAPFTLPGPGQTLFRLNNGFSVINCNKNIKRMAEILMDCISKEDKARTMALSILEKLAEENKFCIQSREIITKVFAPRFEHLLENVAASNQDLLPRLISVIGAMSVDKVINTKLANREEFWKSLFYAMGQCASQEYRCTLYPLLGLMINIASIHTTAIQDYAVVGCKRCVSLLSDPDGGIITRAAGLISVLLPKSTAATQEAVHQGVVKKLLKILKVEGKTSSRYSIKALAVCTASGQQACEELVKLDKKLVTMRRLLGSCDELVVGNAALCLGHCLAVEGAAASLLGTDCVMLLLHHVAGKSERTDVQKNAAIALGKLCRIEPRHMMKLRELNGLEILHSCMKLIT
ncbi:Tetratricopeptide repeat protein 12 [Bagarius yarrelli]|uniref:Tetratricopeptide repeat protein 12 n=1 Tax=Bagarius yarrelli TaxID=175774 RepID=A0A556V044_BAGYA|nr:Tetratricopeptide repeat protein 12 [Bagarius yarrelli]